MVGSTVPSSWLATSLTLDYGYRSHALPSFAGGFPVSDLALDFDTIFGRKRRGQVFLGTTDAQAFAAMRL